MTVMLTLLSLAGVPPLLGFVSKFLLMMVIVSKHNYLFFIILGILNMFMLYFYIQNFRFIISKNNGMLNNIIVNSYVWIDYNIINYIVFINTLNILGIFFVEDILLFTSFWVSNIFI